jgi:hypothetical protein
MGEVRGEATWTPRLVSVDLRGSRGSLALDGGELYAEEDHSVQWDGKLTKIEMDQIKKNAYFDTLDLVAQKGSHSSSLTETVRHWSDYNSVYYHPNSLMEINQYQFEDETNQFGFYNQGQQVFQDSEFLDQLMDRRIRRFMEECDMAQGFEILAGADDAFSGLTASMVEELREEYGKKSILVFSLSSSSKHTCRTSLVNQSLLTKSLQEQFVFYIPLHAPHPQDLDSALWSSILDPRFDTMYQASGYLAAAIESITIPTRMSHQTRRKDLAELQAIMDYNGLSTSALVLGFPVLKQDLGFELTKGMKGEWSWARDLTLEYNSANVISNLNLILDCRLEKVFFPLSRIRE